MLTFRGSHTSMPSRQRLFSQATKVCWFFHAQLLHLFLYWGNQACFRLCGPSLEPLAHQKPTEVIQRRVARRITYSYTNDMPYIEALHCVSKNNTVHQPILVIFGRRAAKRTCHPMVICYPISLK